jgi:dTDP-4-dehydrorhamnose reductase/dTDP-4-dehydrorhamnose 3,5-epimerase
MKEIKEETRIGNIIVKPTKLKDCYELAPIRFGDHRGFFKSITKEELKSLGFKEWNQNSESCSIKGVFRGLHYQLDPYCQTKVVSCAEGEVLDVVVDIRTDSPTYGQYIAVKLSSEEGNALYVPRGFAHGYMCLKDNSLFQYVVDNQYNTRLEDGIAYNDPKINIDWEAIKKEYDVEKITLSEKDSNRHGIDEVVRPFTREPKRFLITGVNGQLGYDIVRELHARGERNILALDVQDMDITDRERVFEIVENYKPDVIFHCAAWTAVDKAEDIPTKVYDINVRGTKNLTEASNKVGAKMVYMSTDYVFDGTKKGIYTEEDQVNPKSVYGETKYLGEEEVRKNPNHFITRISWVFGINGNNFINTMIKLSNNKEELSVVNDQVGSPTYTVDLAKLLVEMSFTDKYGTYNVNNEGYCSWAEFAEYIMKTTGKKMQINPVTTEEYLKITAAKQAYRPRNSKLDKSKLEEAGFKRLPTWQDATDRYVEELNDTNKMFLLEHPVKIKK